MGLLDKLRGRDRERRMSRRADDDEELNAEEEIARNLWANHKMLPPRSKFKHKWDRFMVGLVMYNTIFIIILVCFNRYNPNTGLYWYEGSTGVTTIAPMFIDYLVVRVGPAARVRHVSRRVRHVAHARSLRGERGERGERGP